MSLSAADLELLQIRNKFLENQVQEISAALSELHKQSEIALEQSENRLKTSESLLSAMFCDQLLAWLSRILMASSLRLILAIKKWSAILKMN